MMKVFQRVHIPGNIVSELVYMEAFAMFVLCIYFDGIVGVKLLELTYESSLMSAGLFVDHLLRIHKTKPRSCLIQAIENAISCCLLLPEHSNNA
jgi:hypothetical protein